MASSFIMKICAPALPLVVPRACNSAARPEPACDDRTITVYLQFEVVGLFTVLRNVQTLNLLLLGDAEAGNHVGDFQEDDGADQCEAPGDQYANNLIADLAPVAVEAPPRFAGAEYRVDDLLRKDAGE